MSEIENIPAVEPEPADPAEAADPAEVEADEVEADEVEAEEQAVNADGHPVFAGELFGGPDANQAVHETSTEGIGFDVSPAGEEG